MNLIPGRIIGIGYDPATGQFYLQVNVDGLGINSQVPITVSKTVTLTNDQIKSLPSIPFVILPAPGSGRRIIVIAARILVNNTLGVYDNVDPALQVYLRLQGGVHGLAVSGLLDVGWILADGSEVGVADTYGDYFTTTEGNLLRGNSGYASDFENLPLVLRADNGSPPDTNFTGGHAGNTLKVSVSYVIVEL